MNILCHLSALGYNYQKQDVYWLKEQLKPFLILCGGNEICDSHQATDSEA